VRRLARARRQSRGGPIVDELRTSPFWVTQASQCQKVADGTRTEAWVAEAPSHCLEQTLRDLDRACRQHGVWRVHWRCKPAPAVHEQACHRRSLHGQRARNSARFKQRQSGWVIDTIGEPYQVINVVHDPVGNARWPHEPQRARSVSSTLLIFRRGLQEHSSAACARRMKGALA